MSTNQVTFQQINVNFSTFCRKFQYIDIIYSQNNGTSQQVEVQKRFRTSEYISWYQKCVLFLDIKKSDSWYQEIEFLISIIWFLDINKSISWYQEFDVLIWRIWFLDIKNYISWYPEMNYWYQEIKFLISRNQILDIKKYLINSKTAPQNIFLDLKKSIFWFQKWILDIKKSISWYQEMCIIS